MASISANSFYSSLFKGNILFSLGSSEGSGRYLSKNGNNIIRYDNVPGLEAREITLRSSLAPRKCVSHAFERQLTLLFKALIPMFSTSHSLTLSIYSFYLFYLSLSLSFLSVFSFSYNLSLFLFTSTL